jgi:hypothetical protein
MKLLRHAVGRLLNAFGAPGFIRGSGCRSRLGLPVEVKVDETFTTISISNVRLLFRRLSGKLDGVVVASTDCTGQPPAKSPVSTV